MADEEPRAGELTTANYGWIKPTVGDSDDAWGGYINSDLDGIDSTVHSIQTSVPAASSTAPAMDGTAAVGTGATWARADHVHPSDTTKYNTTNPAGYQTAAQVTAALPVASSTTPAMDGTAAIGTGTTFARADHVHPSDTSRLPLTGGVLSGPLTPAAGVVGTTTNDNAAAGQVGEVISSNVTTGVTLTTSTNANVASISLTPGDWDVSGEVWFSVGTGGAGAIHGGINTASAALPASSSPSTGRVSLIAALSASVLQILSLRTCRVSLAVTATYYLVAQANFASGACTATGNLWARRAR